MVTVAVAGGAGNLGRNIVDALKESPKHTVIVLVRKVSDRGSGVRDLPGIPNSKSL